MNKLSNTNLKSMILGLVVLTILLMTNNVKGFEFNIYSNSLSYGKQTSNYNFKLDTVNELYSSDGMVIDLLIDTQFLSLPHNLMWFSNDYIYPNYYTGITITNKPALNNGNIFFKDHSFSNIYLIRNFIDTTLMTESKLSYPIILDKIISMTESRLSYLIQIDKIKSIGDDYDPRFMAKVEYDRTIIELMFDSKFRDIVKLNYISKKDSILRESVILKEKFNRIYCDLRGIDVEKFDTLKVDLKQYSFLNPKNNKYNITEQVHQAYQKLLLKE